MTKEEIMEIIRKELPGLIATEPSVKYEVLGIVAEISVSKEEYNKDRDVLLKVISDLREDFNDLRQDLKDLREDFNNLRQDLKDLREDFNRTSAENQLSTKGRLRASQLHTGNIS